MGQAFVVKLEMFNLIIMLHEKVSMGFQSCTLRMLTLFAGRVKIESVSLLGWLRPHHSDHILQAETICNNKCIHVHIHMHVGTLHPGTYLFRHMMHTCI